MLFLQLEANGIFVYYSHISIDIHSRKDVLKMRLEETAPELLSNNTAYFLPN